MRNNQDSDGWTEIEVSHPAPVFPGDEVYTIDKRGVKRWLTVHSVDEGAGTFGIGPHTLIIAVDGKAGIEYGSPRSKLFIKRVEESEHAFHSLQIRRRVT